jgi:hypothetical protein
MEKKMAEEIFSENLMRMVAAELHLLNTMTVSREMYGRGYFSLGVGERAIVDQTAVNTIAAHYRDITPQFLAAQQVPQPMGFVTPKS